MLKFKNGNLTEPWILATPSYGLNRALGGGLKSGRFHLFSGPKGSCKSTMAMQTIAEAQRLNKRCLYIDAEHTWETAYAQQCGVDTDNLEFLDEGSNVAEDLMEALLPRLVQKEFDVVVIDSLSMIQLDSMISTYDDKSMASDARSAKFILTKLINVIDRNMHIICISHSSFQKVGQVFMLKAAIGTKTEHVMSTMINFTANDGNNNFRDDGLRLVHWKITKAKQACYPLAGDFYFDKDSARIDLIQEVAIIAQSLNVITGSTWKNYGDRKWHGDAKMLNSLYEEPDLLKEIVVAIKDVDAKGRTQFASPVDYHDLKEFQDA